MKFHRQLNDADSVAVPQATYDLGNMLVQNIACSPSSGLWTTAYTKLEIIKRVRQVWGAEHPTTANLMTSKQFVEWLAETNGVTFLT